MDIYYVYMYLRKDGTPYYVGKGKNNRAYSKRHSIAVPNDKSRIVFIAENIDEQQAFAIEIQTISLYGRRDLGTGILHNRTDGGDGAAGRPVNPQTRQKMSDANIGKTVSEETRAKIGAANKGKVLSHETRQKLSQAKKGKPGNKQSPDTIAKRVATQAKNGNGRNKRVSIQYNDIDCVLVYKSITIACLLTGIPRSSLLRVLYNKPSTQPYKAWFC